jgi:hypothetical protein
MYAYSCFLGFEANQKDYLTEFFKGGIPLLAIYASLTNSQRKE